MAREAGEKRKMSKQTVKQNSNLSPQARGGHMKALRVKARKLAPKLSKLRSFKNEVKEEKKSIKKTAKLLKIKEKRFNFSNFSLLLQWREVERHKFNTSQREEMHEEADELIDELIEGLSKDINPQRVISLIEPIIEFINSIIEYEYSYSYYYIK